MPRKDVTPVHVSGFSDLALMQRIRDTGETKQGLQALVGARFITTIKIKKEK